MLSTTSSRVTLLPLLIRSSPSSFSSTTTASAAVSSSSFTTAAPPRLLSRSRTASAPRLFSSSTSAPITRRFFSPATPPSQTTSPINRIRQFSSTSIRCFAPTAATMGITEIKSFEEWNNVLEDSKSRLVVVDCHATWCGPCKAIAPKIEEYSNTYTNVGFYKVDVDEVPQVAQELGVRAMPTIAYLKDGGKADEFVGAVPPAIEGKIQSLSA